MGNHLCCRFKEQDQDPAQTFTHTFLYIVNLLSDRFFTIIIIQVSLYVRNWGGGRIEIKMLDAKQRSVDQAIKCLRVETQQGKFIAFFWKTFYLYFLRYYLKLKKKKEAVL